MTPRNPANARHQSAPIHDDVLPGLLADPKTLPPKLFYDDIGAALFEDICEQPEYYLTRSELEILRAHAGDIADFVGPRAALIEYGSGSGVKIRLLLDAFVDPASYTPVDISARQLAQVAASIGRDYPHLAVHPACADYTRRFDLPNLPPHRRKVAFYPGSTIGNFDPVPAVAFLQKIRQTVGPTGALILGVDRRKDRHALNSAYNDANGVTARFNLNILARINRELGGNFDLSRFHHLAFFNEEASRIEMYLVSKGRQTVNVAGETIAFEDGETIWTESSYKYDITRLEALGAAAGFTLERRWTDTADRFWVGCFSVAPDATGAPPTTEPAR